MVKNGRLVTLDRMLRNNGLMPAHVIREMQDEHNVNLHADGDGDEYLDRDAPNEIEESMHEVSLEELQCQPC